MLAFSLPKVSGEVSDLAAVSHIDETDLLENLARHPVALMYQYYHQLERLEGQAVPHRRSFNPLKIPALVPWMTTVDVEEADMHSDMRYRYRVVGEGVRDMMDGYAVGRHLHEVCTPVATDLLQAQMRAAVSDMTAKISILQRLGGDEEDTQVLVLIMPFVFGEQKHQLVKILYPTVSLFADHS